MHEATQNQGMQRLRMALYYSDIIDELTLNMQSVSLVPYRIGISAVLVCGNPGD